MYLLLLGQKLFNRYSEDSEDNIGLHFPSYDEASSLDMNSTSPPGNVVLITEDQEKHLDWVLNQIENEIDQ